MKDSEKKLTLSNGVEIPILGFGTYKIEDDKVAVNSVREAIKTGYRHIDTASFYKNEENVGNGLCRSVPHSLASYKGLCR